jgi:hypothetical protein
MFDSISGLASNATRLWLKEKAPKLCHTCRLRFHHEERHNGSGVASIQKIQLGCIRQMQLRTSCRLCRMILQRLGEPRECHCSNPLDACVSLQLVRSEHEAEWLIYFEEVQRGSVLRNSNKGLKDRRLEPVSRRRASRKCTTHQVFEIAISI